MDFSYSEDQNSIRDLAKQIFESEVTPASLKVVDEASDWLHRPVWNALKGAELLGVAIPVEFGGGGMGFAELCLLLEEQGRVAAPVPILDTLVGAGLSIATYGTPEQKKRFLRKIASGELYVATALAEEDSPDPMRPATRATKTDAGWVLSGTKTCVGNCNLAEYVLLAADCGNSELALFMVNTKIEGLSLEAQRTTTGQPMSRVRLEDAIVPENQVLGTPESGRTILNRIMDHMMVGICAIQLGLSKKQLRMLAEYATSRKQFGQPLGAFQAVSQRAGDAYIDVESLRVSYLQAMWRLSQGLESRREILIAKYWAAETGHRVSAAAQHIHGGMGVDCDYPLYRYTLLTKHLEFTLGGANQTLGKLGALLADPNYRSGE